jgi:hypothetical protein
MEASQPGCPYNLQQYILVKIAIANTQPAYASQPGSLRFYLRREKLSLSGRGGGGGKGDRKSELGLPTRYFLGSSDTNYVTMAILGHWILTFGISFSASSGTNYIGYCEILSTLDHHV